MRINFTQPSLASFLLWFDTHNFTFTNAITFYN